MAAALRGFAGEQPGVGRGLIRRRHAGVHVQRGKPQGGGARDVRLTVVADHQALAGVQLPAFQQSPEEPAVGLPAAVVGGQENAVQLLPQAQMPQLVGGEHLLGVAQQPQPVPLLPQQRQRLQNVGIETDVV